MGNVLRKQKQEQVIALGRLGWSLRRIQQETGVRRETASEYLRQAGIPLRPPGGWGRPVPSKPAIAVTTDLNRESDGTAASAETLDSKPAIVVTTDSAGESGAKPAIVVTTDSTVVDTEPAAPDTTGISQELSQSEAAEIASASLCAPYRELIEHELSLGRNATGIYQDLNDKHGFTGGYQSVKRFVSKLRGGNGRQEAYVIIETPPGEECQVDYGTGPMVRDPTTGKYRRTRMFVITMGFSRKCVRLLRFKSGTREWVELHEEAFRRLGGTPRIVVLDNLKEGVLKPDIWDPDLNPLYHDFLAHYGVTALACRVRDPNRKGKVERAVGHAKETPLKGKRFESLEEAQAYLDHWEERWADTRIHGRTKRQVAAMWAEEKPYLQPLPLEPFRYYKFNKAKVHSDGCVEVDSAYYSAPPGWIHQELDVQWDSMFVRLINPVTHKLLCEHLAQRPGRHHIRPEDRPPQTPPGTLALLSRAQNAGPNVGILCATMYERQGQASVRRMQGVLNLVKKYGAAACDAACKEALEFRVPEYRFVRRYLERLPPTQATLRQVDPLIRQLVHYHDLIQQQLNFEDTENEPDRTESRPSPTKTRRNG